MNIAGIYTELDIDLRDGKAFATRGSRIYVKHQSNWITNFDNEEFGILEGFTEFYFTAKPITLALKGGGAKNYGISIPYFRYASIGQRENLRGYLRNRYSGTSILYLNTELRIQLGVWETSFAPLTTGFFVFWDTGRVWYEENGRDPSTESGISDKWHHGYGGGIFLAPIHRRFTFSLATAFSEEESALLLFGLGFGIGR